MMLTHEWGPGEIVGGHRLLRRLGGGETAEVWLAAPALEEDGDRVALKLVHDGATRAAREAEALWRARGPHVVRLRDVVSLEQGTSFLILDAVPHELQTVLAGGLAPGEAVTALVPVAQELARLHAVGVAHRGIRLATIGLDRRGSPVLLGFGAARTGPVAADDRAADCAAFAALALVVLAAVPEGARDEEWHRLVAWLGASQPAGERWLASAIERCYRLAEPQPLALPGAESIGDLVHAAGTVLGPLTPLPPSRAAGPVGRMRALRERVATMRVRGSPSREGATSGVAARLGGVRARFWVPAAVAAVGLVAVLQLPSPRAADAVEPGRAPSAPITATAAARDGVPSPAPTATDGSRSPAPEPGSREARVVDGLGGAFIVEVDGPRGLEHVVLIDGPDGWQVRDYVAAEAPVSETPSAPPPGRGSDAEHPGEVGPLEP